MVADAIYKVRNQTGSPFSEDYLRFIVAGLVAFDMDREMGKGARQRYDPSEKGFAFRLLQKLRAVQSLISDLDTELSAAKLDEVATAICRAYDHLAKPGSEGLNSEHSDYFHVGATKVLHWLNPSLFIMLDRNVAYAFQQHHRVGFRSGTQPGYTAEKYVNCLRFAQEEINKYGCEGLRRNYPNTPQARIFDKVAFVVGDRLNPAPRNARSATA